MYQTPLLILYYLLVFVFRTSSDSTIICSKFAPLVSNEHDRLYDALERCIGQKKLLSISSDGFETQKLPEISIGMTNKDAISQRELPLKRDWMYHIGMSSVQGNFPDKRNKVNTMFFGI